MATLEPLGYQLVITTFVFGFIALSTLSVRLWFRIKHKKYDVSDTCLVAAMICAILQSAIQLILVFKFEYGNPKANVPAHLLSSDWPAKLSYINQILFKLTTPLSKLSLCLLYRALCATSSDRVIRLTRLAIWGTIALIIGAYGSAFFISIFQCSPISYTWNKHIDGHCVNLTQFRMSTAVFNLITSAMVIILPIPTLWRLKKKRPEVSQLIGLILLGLVHTGLTIARFVIMFYPSPLTKPEPQYAHIMPNCLAVAEMDIGIWVATLVVMRPAFQALYRSIFPANTETGSSGLYYAHSGSKQAGRGNKSYDMKYLSAKSSKQEDEFAILETTNICVVSERALDGRTLETSLERARGESKSHDSRRE